MAEFHFWGTDEDRIEIIEAILALGSYRLLPDRHYPDASPRTYEHLEPDLVEGLKKKKRLYVLGPYSKRAVFMEELTQGRDDGSYYVSEARGGPVLSLSVPVCMVVQGIAHCAPGNFSHRSEYWNDAITTPTKASEELRIHYKKILSEIRRHLVKKKIRQNVWIGHRAWDLLNRDKAFILIKGKWWDGKGNLIKSNI